MLETKSKEKVQVVHVNFLEMHLSVGHVENKTQLHYQLLKQNMCQQQIVALKYYG